MKTPAWIPALAFGLAALTLVPAGGSAEDPAEAASQPASEPPVPRAELPAVWQNQTPPTGSAAFRTDFSRATIDYAGILAGGPPKDGIPAIDVPQFVSMRDAAAWVGDTEPVLVIESDIAASATGAASYEEGVTHVYPLQILTWHEIVNDSVGGVPVAVTYCPLCNTGISFARRHQGLELDFGTTGRLRFSNLLMYDRQTETWWQQASGNGVIGFFAGTRLPLVPTLMLSFAEAAELWPDARVLSRETGYRRAYGTNPYVGYDSSARPFLLQGPNPGPGDPDSGNPPLELLDRVVSVGMGEDAVSVAYRVLEQERLVRRALGGEPVVVLWAPGTASALDSAQIAEGRDVGSANAYFERTLDGQQVELRAAPDGRSFLDTGTGSRWNVAGFAVEGPLAGARLVPAPGVQHFWFSHAMLVEAADTRP